MGKIISIISFSLLLLYSCSSNNCPLNNAVTCNFYFYDSDGNPIQYNDYITVKTLLPGYKSQYTYRKLGEQTVISDTPLQAFIDLGYTEIVSTVRKDTVLVNKLSAKSYMSLPMSYSNTSDTLVFQYGNILANDTIILTHKPYPYVELPECGSYMFHTLKDIYTTTAAIDHVELSRLTVNFEGFENVKIFFNGSTTKQD